MSNDNNQASASFEHDVAIAEQHIENNQYLKDQAQEELIDHEDYLLVEALSILEKRAKKYGETFTSVKTVALYLMIEFAGLEREEFKVVFLNTKHQLIRTETVAIGTVDSATVSIREIAKLILQYNAVSIILAHNHPSGSTNPSESDKELTRKIIQAFSLFDVRVLDHFVLADNHYHSMQEHEDINFTSEKAGYQKIS